jgi:N-acetylglucosaminyldiphosphoundecaprenol N-acetyl-beta-D-mannosaminyltransferase
MIIKCFFLDFYAFQGGLIVMVATNTKSKVGFIENQISKSDAKALPTYNAYLLGRKITCITTSGLLSSIHNACKKRQKITVANYNVHTFNMSVQFPWFLNFLQTAEIAHCDGLGVVYALRFMGYAVPQEYRVSYSILMPKLLEYCNKSQRSIYLLGTKSEYLDAAIVNLRKQYPNAKINGHHGYFEIDDEASNMKVVDDINRCKPNILIVGMGMPIQEYWVQRYRDHIDVNAILVGGAVIDRMAGVVPECPEFLSNNGLEWLFRLVREPRRLMTRYLIGNPAFLLQIAFAKSHKFCSREQKLAIVGPSHSPTL